MPRIPLADVSKLSEAVRESLRDKPANVGRMMAVASEPVYHAMAQMVLALLKGSSLPATLREVAILRVGYLSGSAYELNQHEALSRAIGMTDEQMEAIRAGALDAPCLGEAEAAVIAFTDDVVANVRAGDETLAAVRKHLDDTQTVDLTLTVGCYMMVCRFFETTGVELEQENGHEWMASMPT